MLMMKSAGGLCLDAFIHSIPLPTITSTLSLTQSKVQKWYRCNWQLYYNNPSLSVSYLPWEPVPDRLDIYEQVDTKVVCDCEQREDAQKRPRITAA